MERREFLKLTLGFTAAAGTIAATVATVQAAPMLPAGDTAPPSMPKPSEATVRPEEAKTASQDEINAIDAADTDMSAQRRWWRRRRRRVYWRPRRRRLFRRRRRVIYY